MNFGVIAERNLNLLKNDTMTKDEIFNQVIQGTMPQNLRCYERALYYRLQLIMSRYKQGQIAQAHATAEKLEAFRDYEADKVDYESGIDAMHRIAELYKHLELAASNYRKEKTINNADRLLVVTEGLIMKRAIIREKEGEPYGAED